MNLKAFAKVLHLLERKQKRHGVMVVSLMFVVGILDIAGVASIVPFLAVLSRPEIIETNASLNWLYGVSGAGDPQVFMRYLGLGVFALILSGLALKAWSFYEVTKFTRTSVFSFTNRLLKYYLSQPYEWYLGRRTPDLSKTVLSEVGQMVSHTIGPMLRILANGIVVICLLLLLLWLEPQGALMTFAVMGGMFGLAFFMLQGRLIAIGADRSAAQQERFQTLHEVLLGIKAVKLAGLETNYKQRFRHSSLRLANHQASLALIGEMPRYVLEAVTFGGALILVLWMLWTRNGEIAEVLPLIGAFAFAGIKLMPTLQALFRDIAQVSFGTHVFDSIYEALSAIENRSAVGEGQEKAAPMPLAQKISLNKVSYRYPGAPTDALENLTLDIPARSSSGFVGTTGAGKTTLIDILLGLLRPTEGSLTVDSVPVSEENLRAWQRSIGYVPQFIYLSDDTIAANIAFGIPSEEIDWAQVERAGKLAHLDDVVQRLPDGYRTMVGEDGARLSGGQRQRIGIARALYRDPEVLVFDEAMNALDTVTEKSRSGRYQRASRQEDAADDHPPSIHTDPLRSDICARPWSASGRRDLRVSDQPEFGF